MKRPIFAAIAGALVLTFISGSISIADENEEIGMMNMDPIHRLFKMETGEHLYTADRNEVKTLSKEFGWEDEGVFWYAPINGEPVYRIFRPDGYHLYTKDANEVKELTQNQGWLSDNGGQPVFFSGGERNIYRLYCPSMMMHLLTSDTFEYDFLNDGVVWQGEGPAIQAVMIPEDKDVDAHTTIFPLGDKIDVNNLDDGIYNVDVNINTAKETNDGLSMEFTIFRHELFDAVEVHQLKAGDMIYTQNERVKIKSVKEDEGVFSLNSESEYPIDLYPGEGGTYYIKGDNDSTTYENCGTVELTVPKNVGFTDDETYVDTNGKPGKEVNVAHKDMLLHLQTYHKDWLGHSNTTIRIENGAICDFCCHYMP